MNRTAWSTEHLCNICTVITNPYLRVSGSACPWSLSDRCFEFIYDAMRLLSIRALVYASPIGLVLLLEVPQKVVVREYLPQNCSCCFLKERCTDNIWTALIVSLAAGVLIPPGWFITKGLVLRSQSTGSFQEL